MFIIKIGGGKDIKISAIAKEVANIQASGERVIIVHGASVLRDQIAEQLNHPTKTVISPSGVSSVYTDKKAMDIFLMAYPGLSNSRIVQEFLSAGVQAIGLSGVDGKIWHAKQKKNLYVQEGKKTKLLTDNLTGKVYEVNCALVKLLLENKYVPIISSPAYADNGEIVNVDNDIATAKMAISCKAKKLIYLFEAPGLLHNLDDPSSTISVIRKSEIDSYTHVAQGRMKKKLLAVKEALDGGIEDIIFADGRTAKPLEQAMSQNGTTFIND